MVQGLGRCASATGAQAHSWSGKEDPASHSAQPKTNKRSVTVTRYLSEEAGRATDPQQ